jgi:hypothetical protein
VAPSPPSRQSADEEAISSYRKAADLAIEQLDWVINYLYQIRKSEIAHALQNNRTMIVKRYRGD